MATDHLNEAFDALIGGLAWPMVVVTAADPGGRGERAGCLVGFHGQCSIEPRAYAVWLSKANRTCRVGSRSSHLVVHFLGAGDRDLAELFGTETGDDVDKFARCAWTPGPGGVPLLDAGPNRIVGRRVALLEVDVDHVCAVIEPVQVGHPGLGRPLALPDVIDLDPGHPADDR